MAVHDLMIGNDLFQGGNGNNELYGHVFELWLTRGKCHNSIGTRVILF